VVAGLGRGPAGRGARRGPHGVRPPGATPVRARRVRGAGAAGRGVRARRVGLAGGRSHAPPPPNDRSPRTGPRIAGRGAGARAHRRGRRGRGDGPRDPGLPVRPGRARGSARRCAPTDWPCAQYRLAWYESDRGDAAAAVARWRALGSTHRDSQDLATVEPFATVEAAPRLGRNERCWCGSGRKYKACHLGRPVHAPLPELLGLGADAWGRRVVRRRAESGREARRPGSTVAVGTVEG